jgi:hypothetical protein
MFEQASIPFFAEQAGEVGRLSRSNRLHQLRWRGAV